jgi:hypothetical protein
MDTKRWSNIRRGRESYERRESRAGGLPQELFLEISSRCNLRCQMCAIAFDTRHRAYTAAPPAGPPGTGGCERESGPPPPAFGAHSSLTRSRVISKNPDQVAPSRLNSPTSRQRPASSRVRV